MTTQPEDLPVLARNVRRFRLHLAWSQSRLAEECRPPLDRTTILKIERGDHMPSVATVKSLAKALGKPEWMLHFDFDTSSSSLSRQLRSRTSAPLRELFVAFARRVTKVPT